MDHLARRTSSHARKREGLDAETFKNIVQLGGSLHCFHQSVPDYRQLSQTPFNITRWWDPSDRDERWSTGRACLFSLKDYSATDLVRMIRENSTWQLLRFLNVSLRPTCLTMADLYWFLSFVRFLLNCRHRLQPTKQLAALLSCAQMVCALGS